MRNNIKLQSLLYITTLITQRRVNSKDMKRQPPRMICIPAQKGLLQRQHDKRQQFVQLDSYLDIVKTVVELSKGQGWILKFAAVMTACKFLKLNLETLLNFILDFTKLIRGQDLTRKEAEIREAELRIKILELEQTQTQNSSGPEIISYQSNPTHINPPPKTPPPCRPSCITITACH